MLVIEWEYGRYFYRIKDAVSMVILGSLCDLQRVKKIYEWAVPAHPRKFLVEHFGKIESFNRYMKIKFIFLALQLEAKGDEQNKNLFNVF